MKRKKRFVKKYSELDFEMATACGVLCGFIGSAVSTFFFYDVPVTRSMYEAFVLASTFAFWSIILGAALGLLIDLFRRKTWYEEE